VSDDRPGKVVRSQNLTEGLFQVMSTRADWRCGFGGSSGTDAVDINWCWHGEWKNALTLRDEDFVALYELMGKVIEQ
jgi:hypothetical protein